MADKLQLDDGSKVVLTKWSNGWEVDVQAKGKGQPAHRGVARLDTLDDVIAFLRDGYDGI